jgi:hypothetical protein
MTNELMSLKAQAALSTKISILAKYGFTLEDLESLYDLIFAKSSSKAYALFKMSSKDQADLIESIHTLFAETSQNEAMSA